MRSTLRERNLQALNLDAISIEVEKLRRQQQQHTQFLEATRQAPRTPHTNLAVYKKMPLPRSQSSDQSVQKGMNRSLSMIELSSPHGKPLTLHSTNNGLNSEEEEKKRFYESLDPSIDYDELQPEPPRPTTQQMTRLRAGNTFGYPPSSSPPAPPPIQYPEDSSWQQMAQNSRLPNFSDFCPPGAGPGAASSPYLPTPIRHSSLDPYASIPQRHPSTVCPPLSTWTPPMPQPSPPRQQGRPSTSTRYSQDASETMYESPRRSRYPPQPPQSPINSTRYKGLPGQPFKMTGLPPQSMGAQWITPPGCMPSACLQQSTLGPTLRQSTTPEQMRWEPPSCPPDMPRPLTCEKPDLQKNGCPASSVNMPCEGCESAEDSYPPPPRCKPLHPDIVKKLDGNLMPFKIPRCMEDDFICVKRREQWEQLVKDQDCPGAIQSTIDGLGDFNVWAYDIFFGNHRLPDCLPRIEPITLLEAFHMRINYERCQMEKLEKQTYAKDRQDNDEDHKAPPPNDDCALIEKCFKRKYPTELNNALEKLLKAEKGYNFLNQQPEQPLMNIMVDKTSFDLPGIPISIQGFVGTTKSKI
ncbi:unnamed protein product [Ceratitis capitata]|uniref:(Mediterranean fruit fly) hypothetical protein n=1 Tax=Ceratitis capitata TaxID=7213 RepID=A0A811V0D6_CERCA|nr:unnamed protein product [Ceratitis capitata]